MKVKLVGKPADCSYLTPGRVYEAAPFIGSEVLKTITDDEGEEIQIVIDGVFPCMHARPGHWERQE